MICARGHQPPRKPLELMPFQFVKPRKASGLILSKQSGNVLLLSAFSPLLSAACLKIAVCIARGRPEVFTIGSTGLLAAANRAAG
jgi:hypothetical protein